MLLCCFFLFFVFFTATRGYLMHIYQIIVLSVYAYKSTSHTEPLKRHYYIFKYWSTSLELSLELELELHLKCNVILWRSRIICCYLLFKCTERGWECTDYTNVTPHPMTSLMLNDHTPNFSAKPYHKRGGYYNCKGRLHGMLNKHRWPLYLDVHKLIAI